MIDPKKEYIMICKLVLLTEKFDESHKWVAMDSNGSVYAYLDEPGICRNPKLHSAVWHIGFSDGNHTEMNRFKHLCIIHNINFDWRDSLMSIQDIIDYE
jgi:hypothetical protein